MLPHDELYHYGVLGMRWGVRKDSYQRIDKARKKADLRELKIYAHDRKKALKEAESSIDPTDKDAMKRYKLEKKALKAELKARKLEIKLRQPSRNNGGREGQDQNFRENQRNDFNNRFKNSDFAQRVTNKPMRDIPRDGIFKRVLTEAAIKGAGSLASAGAKSFIEPSANEYGKQFMNYLVTEQEARAWKKSYENAKVIKRMWKTGDKYRFDGS